MFMIPEKSDESLALAYNSGSEWRLYASRGSYLIHMLRYILGDDLWRSFLMSFLKTEGFKDTTTPKLFQTLEEYSRYYYEKVLLPDLKKNPTSPELLREKKLLEPFNRHLETFLSQWFLEPGTPEVVYETAIEEKEGQFEVRLEIRQTEGCFKMMPIPIRIEGKYDKVLVDDVLWMTEAEMACTFRTSEKPKRAVLDPRCITLAKYREIK